MITDGVRVTGRLREVVGLSLCADVPDARVGELVQIERAAAPPLLAEIVGFGARGVLLMPLGQPDGLGPGDPVTPLGQRLAVHASDALRGRVLSGLGEPLDAGPALQGARTPITRSAPAPLSRAKIDRVLPLGVRALDAFAPVGEGQRVGVFAAAGVGKSTLLSQLAKNADADVFVVCLIGERGREARDFVEEHLGSAGKARGVVVCATSDTPALVRMRAPLVATTIAESFRDQGQRVLLLVDSITRFARAAREVGLSVGEPPARRGYPPSAFAALPGLFERAGNTLRGSITAFYTVLVEGDDLDEPVADEVRGLLDGHIVLSRALAARGRYPAIDVVHTLSRLSAQLTSPEHRQAAAAVRALVAHYEDKRDLVTLGAYRGGSDALLDRALERMPRIEAFLAQRQDEVAPWQETLAGLRGLASCCIVSS